MTKWLYLVLLLATSLTSNCNGGKKIEGNNNSKADWQNAVLISNTQAFIDKPILVDSLVCNLGAHRLEEGVLQHKFMLKNILDETIIIDEVLTGCSCLKSQYSRKPIGPNDTAFINIRYNPEGKKKGEHTNIIYVSFNNGNHYMLLELHGTTL